MMWQKLDANKDINYWQTEKTVACVLIFRLYAGFVHKDDIRPSSKGLNLKETRNKSAERDEGRALLT